MRYNHLIDKRGGGLGGMIIWTTCDLLIFIICVGMTVGLFQKLFEFRKKWIFIQPSDRFNWIIKPTNMTAISSILAALSFAIYGAIAVIATFFPQIFINYEIDIYIPIKIGCLFKYIYLISRIKNMMDQEPLFKANISKKLWILSIIFAVIKFGSWLIYFSFYFAPRGAKADDEVTYFYEFISVGALLMADMILLTIFMDGQSNIYKYYAAENFAEYEEYRETGRGHEILMIITRDVIVMIFALFFNVIDSIMAGIVLRVAVHHNASERFVCGLNMTIAVIRVLDICGFVLASYFMYKFGYNDYRKFCDSCDRAMFRCCERRYHKQIDNGDSSYRILDEEQLNARLN